MLSGYDYSRRKLPPPVVPSAIQGITATEQAMLASLDADLVQAQAQVVTFAGRASVTVAPFTVTPLKFETVTVYVTVLPAR